jgi:hypothetical protein
MMTSDDWLSRETHGIRDRKRTWRDSIRHLT